MHQLRFTLWAAVVLLAASRAAALPPGFVSSTISIGAPPAAIALDGAGGMYVVEAAIFGENTTQLHVLDAAGAILSTTPIVGDELDNFFVGGMTFDPVAGRLLVTDNAGIGRIYSFDASGDKQLVAEGIQYVSDVKVRSTGEIFVSTATNSGEVLIVDRSTGATTPVLSGLAFGAGLAFEDDGDLIVQDVTYDDQFNAHGRLQRLPISDGAGLQFGAPEPLAVDTASSYGVAVVGSDQLLATGAGGLYSLSGPGWAETNFDNNGNPGQFSTALVVDPGAEPFAPFAGAAGGRVLYVAEAGFAAVQDDFLTVVTPAEPADFNSDGVIDGGDLAAWSAGFGQESPERFQGDVNGDGAADGGDFLAWQLSYQGVQPLATAQIVAASVPEPHNWVLVEIAGAICLAQAWRRVW